MIFICFAYIRFYNYELKWIFLYLIFVRIKNFKLISILMCFTSFKLDGTLNLDQSSYILPMLDFVTYIIFICFASIRF